ncbi:hypothetical protein [Reichenbachiella ulvae]|uniref:DUF4136 domain-containing protein n=1 Tax=Reichenbachiella ulvae TaxID=2980104 RepID=A0ABT3CSE2_9BACT|nr:hypothetical protein [Reichenbachiella ulvae]MCV9386598.1 hypothetical protein [Reichenbachiella ulvae]
MANRTLSLIFVVLVFLTACQTNSGKRPFEHNYAKYWNRYSDEQLTNELFADTLKVGPDFDGGFTNREFYVNTTSELLNDLRDDINKIDSLFPQRAFDELTIRQLPLGFKQTFTDEQANRFLEILNDPTSFDWSETTYEPEFRVNFLNNNNIVATLTLGDNFGVVKTEPNWPTFKKMKFGALKTEKRAELRRLMIELGY